MTETIWGMAKAIGKASVGVGYCVNEWVAFPV